MIRNMLKVVIIIKSTLNVRLKEALEKYWKNPILRVIAQWTHLYMIDSHLAQREIL